MEEVMFTILGWVLAVVAFGVAIWSVRLRQRDLENHLTFIRKAAQDLSLFVKDDWSVLATGDSGSIELEKAWLRKAQEIYTIFCDKQHDYGPNNIAMGGLQGLVLRMMDKISRAAELTGLRTGEVKDPKVAETRRDIWIDHADYGMIALMVEDGDWPDLDVKEVYGPVGVIKSAMTVLDPLPKAEQRQILDKLRDDLDMLHLS
jgi:hypothetical protein